jgi:phosphoglycerol geranylgeranyltransferase
LKNIYPLFTEAKSAKKSKFAVLIDPDKMSKNNMELTIKTAIDAKVDFFFLGGSLVVNDNLDTWLKMIHQQSEIPSVLFPGSSLQLSLKADALLFLSLISGRNPELLIGKHVQVAPFLKMSQLDIIPTGYVLIDGGVQTTVQYISNTSPIPANKNDIAVCTAMAGEMLGLKTIYMDAGSGAINPISPSMIHDVSQSINIPLIVGGGIRNAEHATLAAQSGADVVVVGNAIEKSTQLIVEISEAIHHA